MSTYRISSGVHASYGLMGSESGYLQQVAGGIVEGRAVTGSEANSFMEQDSDSASYPQPEEQEATHKAQPTVYADNQPSGAYVVAISRQAEQLSLEQTQTLAMGEPSVLRVRGYADQAYQEGAGDQQGYQASGSSTPVRGSRINFSV